MRPAITSPSASTLPRTIFTRHGKGEYVRGLTHTNTVEGFYSVFKRGMKGVYQHYSEKHLHRYVAEFDFCYSNRLKLSVGRTPLAPTMR